MRSSDAGDETQGGTGDQAWEAAGARACIPEPAGGEVTGDADEGRYGQGGQVAMDRTSASSVHCEGVREVGSMHTMEG